ncbi:MAG: hypothetical protein ACRD0F_07995, partial [Acidimicrobiales bacterium]
MNPVASLLDSRAGFTLTALVVTWVAIVVLALMVVGLQVQLRGAAATQPLASPARPYGRLVGSALSELSGDTDFGPGPRLVVFLSRGCRACARLLDQLQSPAWSVPATVAWTDGPP